MDIKLKKVLLVTEDGQTITYYLQGSEALIGDSKEFETGFLRLSTNNSTEKKVPERKMWDTAEVRLKFPDGPYVQG